MPEPLLWFPRTHHIDLLTQAKQCFVRSISTRVPNLSRRISSKDHRLARSGDQSGKMAGRPLLWAPRSGVQRTARPTDDLHGRFGLETEKCRSMRAIGYQYLTGRRHILV